MALGMQRVSIKSRTSGGSRGKMLTQQKRRAARTSAVTTRRMFQQAYNDLYVNSAIPVGAEIKAIDIPASNWLFRAPSVASSIILLNGIQSGDAFYNRIGSRIEMKNLHIRGNINNAATSTVGGGRFLIVYDKQPNGAFPIISDILQSRDQTGAATTTYSSEINLDNRARFAIIRDMQFYFPPVTNTAGVLTNGPNFPAYDDQPFDLNVFVKLKGLQTLYKSPNVDPTTIASITTGALYAVFVGNVDGGWQFSGGFRLRYDDK